MIVAPHRARSVATLLGRDRRGATAVEFGLVAGLFLAMVLFTAELGFYLYAQLSLDYATAYSARQLLTGNGRPAGVSSASFLNATLCPSLQTLLSCDNIVINLFPLASGADYSSVPPPSALLANGKPNPAAAQFTVGQNSSLMIMQVIYLAPNFMWPLSYATGAAMPIYSTAAYVNET
jgi:hypothetical protein